MRTTDSCRSKDEVNMKIAIATNNRKKLAEIRAVLGGFFEEMYSLDDLGISVEIEETGSTLTENALIKARAILGMTGLASLADDSGLMCDALDGAPGVYSARYAGEGHDDKANNALLIANLAGRDRSAQLLLRHRAVSARRQRVHRGRTRGRRHPRRGTRRRRIRLRSPLLLAGAGQDFRGGLSRRKELRQPPRTRPAQHGKRRRARRAEERITRALSIKSDI